jgi:hypothetical protein
MIASVALLTAPHSSTVQPPSGIFLGTARKYSITGSGNSVAVGDGVKVGRGVALGGDVGVVVGVAVGTGVSVSVGAGGSVVGGGLVDVSVGGTGEGVGVDGAVGESARASVVGVGAPAGPITETSTEVGALAPSPMV